MSFSIFLSSHNGNLTGLSSTNKCSLSYTFDFSSVPPHPDGDAGKYSVATTLLTQALASAATSSDIGIVYCNFNCIKYVYEGNKTMTSTVSDYVGYLSPLAYSSSNLISQYVNVPLYMTKPQNNYFTVEMKTFASPQAYFTQISSTVNYIMVISFTAIIEGNGLLQERKSLIDYKSIF